ncbi:MAG: phosphate ABC transporter permease PstA [Acidobacteriota bacterium]|jgi:phosphate transport system permease protein
MSNRDRLGESLTSLCAGALALNLVGVMALLVLLGVHGLGYFWQKDLVLVELRDGSRQLGEIQDREPIPPGPEVPAGSERIQMKVGNRDLSGADFIWIDEPEIVERTRPAEAVVLERMEWGNAYGTLVEIRRDENVLAGGPEEARRSFAKIHPRKLEELEAIRDLEKGAIGEVNYRMERLRLEGRRLEGLDLSREERAERQAELDEEIDTLQDRYETLEARLFAMRKELVAETAVLETADGQRLEVPVGNVVRAVWPNSSGLLTTCSVYLSRVWEFVAGQPRESNTEGGIFPAIFGTVMMVFLMSFAVVPFGVLAALYLREYARQGPLVRTVRIAVNNLAGVPSIVFGVFGLGFFVYLVGGTIDRIFYPEALPTPTYGTGGILWASLTLALLTVPVVIVATEEGLASVPRITREGSLALGATKFETTWRVVIPAAAPGILTGVILAMARAAGEVAPLMIVGMVKLAPSLPVDHHFPFIHLERKFMHLGFHIYDVGFQSPNVDATKPLVFATALLLILVVTTMNLVAIGLRNHLRRKYASSAV